VAAAGAGEQEAQAELWRARPKLRAAIELSDRILMRLARHSKLTFSEKAAIREARQANVLALTALMQAESTAVGSRQSAVEAGQRAAGTRQKAVASSAAPAAGEQGDPRRSRAPAEPPERGTREDQRRERNHPPLVSAEPKSGEGAAEG
jgi:hypothetical protein